MADKKYNILKAASWYTIGNIMIKGINFFVLPVFTRLMSTHEYGVYGVYVSYLSIIETIILLGLSSTIAIAHFAKEVDRDSYLSTAICIPAGVTVICMAIINVILLFCGTVLSMNAVLWNCLFLTAGTGAISGILSARLIIDGRYKLSVLYSGLNVVLNVGISLALCATVYRTHDVHLARVFGSTASTVLGMVFLLLVTKTGFNFKRVNAKYAFAWGVPLLFHTLATVVLTQSDRILIRYMVSYSSAGIYAVATTLATIPLVLESSLAQAWQPWFYGKLDRKEYGPIRWLNDRYILFFAVIISCFIIVSPDVVRIFTEKDYWGSIYSLVPLSISVFGELLYSIPASIEYYSKKTTYLMMGTLITVVVNILLDVLFISLFGYHGAAYATAISKLALFLMHCCFARKVDKNHVFSGKIVIACLIFLALLNYLTLITLDLYVVRYAILLCLAIPCGIYLIKNKTLLLNKLKEK